MTAARPLPERRLDVRDLALQRGERRLFAGLSFECGGGETLLLRGRNGAGKTSLLFCLLGLIQPAEGSLVWSGRDAEQRPGEDTHFIGHQPGIKPSLTVRENLSFWCAMTGGDKARIPDALEQAGLWSLDGVEAGVLSAGQTRRLALARLLVSPRPVWLLDEPSSALDAEGDRWVAGLIAEHAAQGGLVIAATHRDLLVPGRVIELGAAL